MANSPMLLIAALLLVSLLTWLQAKINLPREKRCMQWSFPIAAALICLVLSILWGQEQERVFNLIELPEAVLNADSLIMNCSIALVFIFYKIIAVMRRRKKEPAPADGGSGEIQGFFYDYDSDYAVWELQERWVNARLLLKIFVYMGTFVTGTFLGILWMKGLDEGFWTHIYPATVQVVLIEILSLINGCTRAEHGNLIRGDDAISERINNFYKLRIVYEALLPNAILSATTSIDNTFRKNTDLIERIMAEGTDIDEITATFLGDLDDPDSLSPDGIDATRALMRSENVMFLDPFYRDLSPYLMLPLFKTLISGKKVVVIAGRNSIKDDIAPWLREEFRKYTGTTSLWRVKELGIKEPDCEIGIVVPSQLHDISALSANREFFVNTGFVLMIEPSLLVNTGQIGLTVMTEELGQNEPPTICVIDRNTEGLVDSISHIMRAEITNVVAAPLPRSVYSGIAWDADGDFKRQTLFSRETKYLGDGIELAAIAIRNQIPTVSWFGETKAPIRDIKWIAGQNYSAITKYMNLPAQQKSIADKIRFVSNIWECHPEKEQFIVAEDEFCNMFSTMKVYFSRGTEQTFVNVLSENYLFRDYMRCNPGVMLSNPNAIPSIVPDYAKSERNVLYKLLLLMSVRQIPESEIVREMRLLNYQYSEPLAWLSFMLKKYTDTDERIITVKSHINDEDGGPDEENTYEIYERDFIRAFETSLRSAYYIVEDERYEDNYLDTKLYGHVAQNVLPGQFVTYEGKYYRVKSVTPEGGVILRRAADLYTGRKYYRQIRNYRIEPGTGEEIVNIYDLDDIEIAELCSNICVETAGYLEMKSNNDLRTAKVISFTKDTSLNAFRRSYRNKNILRVMLPDTDDRMRFTFCILLSEICRTIFPSACQYLAVTTARPEDIDGILNYALYSIDGDYSEDYIYIFEDSDIDLGLIGAVERNWTRLMELMADYLDWHFEKMREMPSEDPVQLSPLGLNSKAEEEEVKAEKRKGRLRGLLGRIAMLFGSKEEEDFNIEDVKTAEIKEPEQSIGDYYGNTEEGDDSVSDVAESASTFTLTEDVDADDDVKNDPLLSADDMQSEGAADIVEANSKDTAIQGDTENDMDPDITDPDGTDIFEEGNNFEAEDFYEFKFREHGISEPKPTRYQKECYLKFGFDIIDERLKVVELRQYLNARGWSDNALRRARKAADAEVAEIELEDVNHCDFCGRPLTGVSYERLSDGRIRCNECSSTAITTEVEFIELFKTVIGMLEGFYGIEYKKAITAWMTDSKTLARSSGRIFQPSTDVATRSLGYAVQMQNGTLGIVVENGSPRLAAIATLAHELTHIWQYINWNDTEIKKLYPDDEIRLAVYEGMAKWAEIQYLYLIGETSYAKQQEFLESQRDDAYGLGLRSYIDRYPFVKDGGLVRNSPFKAFPPI